MIATTPKRVLVTALAALPLLMALAGCSSASPASGPQHPVATSAASQSIPSETPTPTGPSLTVSQQQAVIAAQEYLNLNSGFSYQGLIDQLTSTSGSGFAVADATVAVNSLNVDFNAQAVLAAQGYMKIGGFSHASLVDQLSSSSGSQFTTAQAEYATGKVGL